MVFCRTYKEKQRKKKQRKLNGAYTFTFYPVAKEVNREEWDGLTGKKNFFMGLDYLSLLEELHPGSIIPRYVLVYKDKVPVFACYFQVIDFTADVFGDLLVAQLSELKSQRMKLFDKYVTQYKDQVIMRLVTCGNNIISGEHGLVYADHVKRDEAFTILEKITRVISKEEKLRGTISATLIKDFYTEHLPGTKVLEEKHFTGFTVEPNMIIDIPEGLVGLKDYVALYSKKYRNRAKGIFKSGAAITKKDLSLEETKKHNKDLYALYNKVFAHAKFKILKLSEKYFVAMKERFPETFSITGYYLGNTLVAFDSYYDVEEENLEAHYIGLDYEANKEYELYQNILYHLIEVAILRKKKHVNLGRTASEIKSTVGARAHDLTCYISPQNTLSKIILKPFISFLQPGEWVPRNPFKEEEVVVKVS